MVRQDYRINGIIFSFPENRGQAPVRECIGHRAWGKGVEIILNPPEADKFCVLNVELLPGTLLNFSIPRTMIMGTSPLFLHATRLLLADEAYNGWQKGARLNPHWGDGNYVGRDRITTRAALGGEFPSRGSYAGRLATRANRYLPTLFRTFQFLRGNFYPLKKTLSYRLFHI
jgi:hypothetical protein